MTKDNSQNMQDLFQFLVYAIFLLLLVLQYFFSWNGIKERLMKEEMP